MQIICLPETLMMTAVFEKSQTYVDSEGETRTLEDDNGQPLYDASVNILAKTDKKVVNDFRLTAKESRTVLHKIFTNTVLREDDKVDGKRVTRVLDHGEYEAG